MICDKVEFDKNLNSKKKKYLKNCLSMNFFSKLTKN